MTELYNVKFYYLMNLGSVVDGPYFTYPEAVKARHKYNPYSVDGYKIFETEVELKSVGE